jgi:hypothetical protein
MCSRVHSLTEFVWKPRATSSADALGQETCARSTRRGERSPKHVQSSALATLTMHVAASSSLPTYHTGQCQQSPRRARSAICKRPMRSFALMCVSSLYHPLLSAVAYIVNGLRVCLIPTPSLTRMSADASHANSSERHLVRLHHSGGIIPASVCVGPFHNKGTNPLPISTACAHAQSARACANRDESQLSHGGQRHTGRARSQRCPWYLLRN